jgi:SAM-dependent methyltransferase
MTAETAALYFGRDLEAMSAANNYLRWIAEDFRRYLVGRVAEVGAGTGNFSRLLLEAGVEELTALEPSLNMYARLREVFAGDPRVTTVHSSLIGHSKAAGRRFDTVVYVNVLEHVEDDAGELDAVQEVLARGGHLCIFVPALRWLFSDLDRQVGHHRRYDREQLVSLVEGRGFEVLEVRYFDVAGVLPWYVTFVLLKRPITAGGVGLYDRLVVPVTRRLEARVRAPLGKNLLLVARKPPR